MDELVIVVGRLPRTKKGAALRRTLRETLDPHPYLHVELADEASRPENVRALIDLAFLGLFDVSRSRDFSTFLDLGYALGRGKYCILLNGPRTARVDGFAGDISLDYLSVADLRDTLAGSVIEWIAGAIAKYTAEEQVFANMDARLIAPLAQSLLEADVSDAFTIAGHYGFSEEQVETTLDILIGLGMAQALDNSWTVTETGRRDLPRLLAKLPAFAVRQAP